MSENTPQEILEAKPVELETYSHAVDEGAIGNFEAEKFQNQPAKKEENLFASLGFALGFTALLFLNTYAIPAVLGLILSFIGLAQIKRKGEEGRGFAIWGIVFSLLSIIWLGLQYLGVVTTPGMVFNFIKGILGFRT